MLIGLGAIRNPVLKFLSLRFERFTYRNSAHIIALSGGMRNIITATGYPAQNVTVIPNASDIERFDIPVTEGRTFRKQFEWLQDRKLVLYAGTIGKANGVDYLVRVAQEMLKLDESVRFLVIGKGGDEENVRLLARETGTLNRNFFMLPPLSKQGIPAAFSAADVSLVLLRDVKELWTNSSNKFFDGLAAGKPVVVNNVGWQSELLAETGAGFDLDPRDYAAAAHTLHRFLQDDDWLSCAGERARDLAKTQFDRNELADRMERVLTCVNESHRKTSHVV
jgi:glycosyltransferase involved in cell wall biosynthesis